MGKLKKLKKLSLFRSYGVKGVKELRHNFYKQHALGYELLGLQGVLEPHAKLLLPIKH